MSKHLHLASRYQVRYGARWKRWVKRKGSGLERAAQNRAWRKEEGA